MNQLFRNLTGSILLLFAYSALGAGAEPDPVLLKDSTERFVWRAGYYSVYFDSIHSKSFNEIRAIQRKGLFTRTITDDQRLFSTHQEMWAYIDVQHVARSTRKYLIELYDFHIDEYDIYVLNGDSLYYHFEGGDSFEFEHRKIAHKNFLNEVVFNANTQYSIFIRVQSKESVAAFGTIRTYPDLLEYSNNEYLILSIYYGFLLLMFIYCVSLFAATFEITYFYFSLNVISVVLYSLSNDGLGFQYFWPNQVVLNGYFQSISVVLFSVTSLLYTSAFLQIKKISNTYIIVLRSLMTARVVLFAIGFLFYEPLLRMYQIDIVVLVFIFYVAIDIYFKDYIAARFFILAYAALFIGFTTHILMVLGIARNNIFTVYAMNFGTFFQLFLFSFALADRVRIVNNQTRDAQLKLINQLKENEVLKDKVTQELEEKVKERTKELEYKNQQLDAFVYKASHDIKGPLKSIIGLAKLGLIDVHEEGAKEYFRHIEKSTSRLDVLLQDLLQVSKIKNLVIESTLIDFNKIINEIKEGFSNIESFSDFYINVEIKQDRDFYSDEQMIYSIFQNLIENAFNYRDHKKQKSSLYIRIEVDKQKSLIEFIDNGLGIDKGLKDKVFDMFFRASEIAGGTGLGLYLVKTAVNKIGGRIQVETEINKGTTFRIVI